MKNLAKVITSVVLVCTICFSLAVTAFAATKVSKVEHTSPQYGGGAATVFYVNAKNTKKATLDCYGIAGTLTNKNGSTRLSNFRHGYFEVLIYGKQSNGTWKQISKTNIKNKASTTLSMKGYTQYKVRVYSWKTSTIGSYIGGKFNSSAYWADWKNPSYYFKAKSNIKSLTR